jgi:hypothetical protein
MSRIYFKSASTAEAPAVVQGSERYRLCSEVHRQLTIGRVRSSGQVLPTVADLNACLQLGNDMAVLVARLSGQIENIVWVDGPNRPWLAELIRRGIDTDVLRFEAGWPEVTMLLLQRDDEPVFIYCSAGEFFPTAEGFAGDAEAWQALSDADRWAHAEGVLRNESAREDATGHLAEHPVLVAAPFSREFRPSNWHQFFFAEETN